MSACRVANSSRPARGSKRRIMAETYFMRGSTAFGAMLDLDHCASAETHELLRRIFELDPHGKTLCDPHPIQRALHIRDRARNVDPILIGNAPADSLDKALNR